MTLANLDLRIRPFAPGDEESFRRLNEEWITAYFRLEQKDIELFADPRKIVLDKGGHIFLVKAVSPGEPSEVIGCCALLPRGPAEFEVTKMAVSPSLRGGGVGRKLLLHTIDAARSFGARRLYLETSHKLPNAIHLYESVGFRHLPPERITPSLYARSDTYMELPLAE